jgi:hypothetical protein
VIASMAMEIGIEPTVRNAADLGFIPVVLADLRTASASVRKGRKAEAGHSAFQAGRVPVDISYGGAVTFEHALCLSASARDLGGRPGARINRLLPAVAKAGKERRQQARQRQE